MEIHDDILDTIELIGDEMKKYAIEIKENDKANEYIVSYDRLQVTKELE
jgi:hypothetical protein